MATKYIIDISRNKVETDGLSVDAYCCLESVLKEAGIHYSASYESSIVPSSIRLYGARMIERVVVLEDDPAASSSQTVTGSFEMDSAAGTITVVMKDMNYVFRPLDGVDLGDLYRSITGMAKYSAGRALAYLKTKAVGVRAEDMNRQESLRDWLADLSIKHEGVSYRVRTSTPTVLEARAGDRNIGLWLMDRKYGLTRESQTYSDWESFEAAVFAMHPDAQQVKSDATGDVLFLDPESQTPIAAWMTSTGRGTIDGATTESQDRILQWINAQ